MAALTVTNTATQVGQAIPTINTLTASDTLTVSGSATIIVQFLNTTGGLVNLNLVGADATSVVCAGTATTITTSSGYDIAIANTETRYVTFKSIQEYLKGTITITSDAVGVEAIFYQL